MGKTNLQLWKSESGLLGEGEEWERNHLKRGMKELSGCGYTGLDICQNSSH